MNVLPAIGQNYLLRRTSPVSRGVWLNGNFCIENIENSIIRIRFENNRVLSVNVNDWPIPNIEETVPENPTSTYTKPQLYNFVSNIIENDVRSESDIKKFLDKIKYTCKLKSLFIK